MSFKPVDYLPYRRTNHKLAFLLRLHVFELYLLRDVEVKHSNANIRYN